MSTRKAKFVIAEHLLREALKVPDSSTICDISYNDKLATITVEDFNLPIVEEGNDIPYCIPSLNGYKKWNWNL